MTQTKKSMLKGFSIGLGLLLLLNINHADAQVKDDGWKQLFQEAGYTGGYYWTIIE